MGLKNKRGILTLMLLVLILTAFFVMIILGVGIFGLTIVDGAFGEIDNFSIGNMSFAENYQATLQPGIIAASTTGPVIISTGILLGMVFCLMLVGFTTKKISKLWILLDIIIIIVAEMIAAVISANFVIFMNITPEFLAIYSNTLSAGSRFVINLPIYVPIVGALIILTTHLTNDKKEEKEDVFV